MRNDSSVVKNELVGLGKGEKNHFSAIVEALGALAPTNNHHQVGIAMTACVAAIETDSPEDILDRLSYMEQWINDARKMAYGECSLLAFGKNNARGSYWFFGPYVHGTGIED